MKKVLAILLIATCSTGVFAQKGEKKSPSEMLDKRVEKAKTELGLSDDQAAKFKVALSKKTEVVEPCQNNIKTANQTFQSEIEKIFTKEQLAKFKEDADERKKEREMKSK